jgi:carbamate kinase
MKEKLMLAAVVILGAILAASRAQTPVQTHGNGTNVGRYQIYHLDEKTSVTVLRIDTVTGESWALMPSKMPDGTELLLWAPVPASEKPIPLNQVRR